LELRIAAARWQLSKYIQAFEEGIDPHSMVTAAAIFGKEFLNCNGWPQDNGGKWVGDAYNYRQLAKIIQYAFQYKATVETGTRIIQSTEVDDPDTGGTKMPYLRMSVREVRQMRNAWLSGVPELEKGWNKEIQFFRDNGFIQEPIHGRKRYCLDGENPNEIVNFPIQGSASALINDAMIAIWQDIPLHKWGPGTGLLTQTHDALVVECPEDKAQEVKEIIEHHMNKYHPDLPGVKFTATADKGYSWKEVG
jgi:DNA polymerase I-like protein with 3'-5' exonuclease and polymerase domains